MQNNRHLHALWHGFLGSCLLVSSFWVCTSWVMCRPGTRDTVISDTLAVAGVIVAGSAVVSLIFGVITYLETAVIRANLSDAELRLKQMSKRANKQMHDLGNTYRMSFYLLADKAIVFMYDSLAASDAFQTKADTKEVFQQRFYAISLLEIDIHLASGTPRGLRRAIELSYKAGAKKFLSIERSLCESAALNESENAKNMEYYFALKDRLLARIPEKRQSTSGS